MDVRGALSFLEGHFWGEDGGFYIYLHLTPRLLDRFGPNLVWCIPQRMSQRRYWHERGIGGGVTVRPYAVTGCRKEGGALQPTLPRFQILTKNKAELAVNLEHYIIL